MNYRVGILLVCLYGFLLPLHVRGETADTSAEAVSSPEAEKSFPLSLKQAVGLALKANRSIAIERLQPLIREEKIDEAKSAFDFTVSSGVNTGKTREPATSIFAVPEIGTRETVEFTAGLSKLHSFGTQYDLEFESSRLLTNSTTLGLDPEYRSRMTFSVTQHLLKDFGPKVNKSRIVIAQNDREISDEEFRSRVIDVTTEVHEIYWELVFRIQDLEVKKESLALARDLEERVRIQVEVGTLPPIEILQAQASVAAREEEVIAAENLIHNTEDRLRQLLDLKDWDISLVPTDTPAAEPIEFDVTQLLESAKQNRPDYRQALKTAESRKIDVHFWKNQMKPQLDLVGNVSMLGISGESKSVFFAGETLTSSFEGPYSESLEGLAKGDFINWTIGLTVSYPLENRRARSGYVSSKLELESTLTRIEELEQNIQLDVRTASRQVLTDWKQVQAGRVARQLAQEQLDAEVKKFEVGESTSFEVLEFQKVLAEQRSNEILSVINFNRDLARLDRATGTTLEKNDISISSMKDRPGAVNAPSPPPGLPE